MQYTFTFAVSIVLVSTITERVVVTATDSREAMFKAFDYAVKEYGTASTYTIRLVSDTMDIFKR